MTTRRQLITDALTQAKRPGPTADQVARQFGLTLEAVMNHLKHIRKTCTVVATPHKHDARIKHYHIKPSKAAKAVPVAAVIQAPEPPPAKKAPLSATELEAAICDTLRTHASVRRPMCMDTLRTHLQAPAALVRPAVIALVQRETVLRVKGGYHLPTPVPRTLGQTVAGPRVVDVMHAPPYEGAELRPYNGRPGAMDAYRLPSRGMRA